MTLDIGSVLLAIISALIGLMGGLFLAGKKWGKVESKIDNHECRIAKLEDNSSGTLTVLMDIHSSIAVIKQRLEDHIENERKQ